MPRGASTHERNAALQALRAIAALCVLMFHAGIGLPAGFGYDALKHVLFFGFMGVDVFFVVSGYVVTWTAMNIHSAADAFDFSLRRLGRIFGGYWSVLVVCAVLPFFAVPTVHPGGHWLPSVLLIEPTMDHNVLPVAYTLVYELWFYALLVVAMLCAKSDSGRRQLLVAAAIFLRGWHTTWALLDFPAWRTSQQPLPFLLSGLLLQFLAGAFLYLFGQGLDVLIRRWVALVLLAGGIVATVMFWQWFGLTLVRAVVGGAVGLGALMLALSLPSRATAAGKPGWLGRLGDASFSLYLLHTLVLTTVATLAKQLLPTFVDTMPALAATVGVALSVGAALAWYRWVELPIYRGWCAWVARRSATS